MPVGKTTLILSFAFVGFLLGATLYFVINWAIINNASIILYIPILTFPPWLTAGIAGSLFSVIIAFVLTYFRKQ